MAETSIAFEGKVYSLDDYGFLDPPEQWDENFAQAMAQTLGIPGRLTERHWQLIRYIRKKVREENTVPISVIACADNDMRLDEFKSLFPTGYFRGACRIAGINYDFLYRTNYWLTYETTPLRKEKYRLDPLGFLEDFNQWDEEFAELIVTQEWRLPQGLTERNLQIIRYLRDFYRRTHTIPTIIETCKANGLSLEQLHQLFPAGYRRGACRIAGLPFFA
jgi:TusE/DsrC/DsvC family sulfur relay protein